MKCVIPEISWNNRDPVFSLDIQPKTDEHIRLATSGSDCHIVIWYLVIDDNGSISVEPAADLNKHQKAVNVVRWSPSGEFLASGDDESSIIIWKKRTDVDPPPLENDSEEYKESWTICRILRGHMDDVYDISWSPDSNQLMSGSVDNTVIIWNLKKSTKHIIQSHKGFVQGVTWDPLDKFFATLSSDRTCRIFDAYTRKVLSRSNKGTLPFPESSPLYGKTVRLYHDDTLKSYFRRLTFSPDGNLLIAPAGCVETDLCRKKMYFTYIYTRYSFKQPTLALPFDQFTIAVRCCPILFKLRPDGPKPMIPLSYRMIIAVASQTSVVFYDTQQIHPFAAVTNIHYTRITDITWSSDGLIVAISSTDGFCSLITFKSGELGDIYVPDEKTRRDETSVTKVIDINDEPQEIIKNDINISDQLNIDNFTGNSQDISLHLEESQNPEVEEINEDQEEMEVDDSINETNNEINIEVDKHSNNDNKLSGVLEDTSAKLTNSIVFPAKEDKQPTIKEVISDTKNTKQLFTIISTVECSKEISNQNNEMKTDTTVECSKETDDQHDKLNDTEVEICPNKTDTIKTNINETTTQILLQSNIDKNDLCEKEQNIVVETNSNKSDPIKMDVDETNVTLCESNTVKNDKNNENHGELTISQEKINEIPSITIADTCKENNHSTMQNETNETSSKIFTPKAPRRVQLITLSSPKNKKKL